jgi:prepilin-type processing-associated H-X9-DG protein
MYDAVMYPKSRTRAVDISDGQSNTLIVGERPPSKDLVWGWWASPYRGDITMGAVNTYRLPIKAAPLPGAAPTWCPAAPYFGPGSLENPCDTQHFWSFHPFGSNWLFADGSVHFIHYSAALQVPKMAPRAGSEVVDWLDVF